MIFHIYVVFAYLKKFLQEKAVEATKQREEKRKKPTKACIPLRHPVHGSRAMYRKYYFYTGIPITVHGSRAVYLPMK
jgi:hypothetical protein